MSRVKEPFDPCAEKESTSPGCYRPPLERLRFWNGRFLVARDLRDQQEDIIRRLEYHQSFAHGEGVLCGFQVQEHPREECRDRWLVIDPGMAYDCCGRTLWMPDRRAIEIPWPEEPAPGEADRPDRPPEAPEPPRPEHGQHPPRPPQGSWAQQTPWEQRQPEQEYPGTQYPEQQRPQQQHPGQKHPEPQPPEGKRPEPVPPAERPPDPQWFILACRVECPTDPVPALYADDLCDPVRHEHGRLREDVTIRVVPAADVSDECW
ncbi:MAG: hypothetical protein HY701_05785, partial [Gemmatimonadetes bacterium]|nr:hypothetical protein [Gemmatimonadota bacterium]